MRRTAGLSPNYGMRRYAPLSENRCEVVIRIWFSCLSRDRFDWFALKFNNLSVVVRAICAP
jgi:hypothetical protein